LLSSEPYRCPRLREAATTLAVMFGRQRAETTNLKYKINKISINLKNSKKCLKK